MRDLHTEIRLTAKAFLEARAIAEQQSNGDRDLYKIILEREYHRLLEQQSALSP